MKRYYLSVGYPLTYAVDQSSVYILEQMEGTVALTTEELKEWTRCLPVVAREQESEELRTLIRKGAVFSGNSLSELLDSIRKRNAVRQGFGFLNNDKYCLMLGKEYWYPSEVQLRLWSAADGCTTIDNLLELFEDELIEMEVFKNLSVLMRNDSLYLR